MLTLRDPLKFYYVLESTIIHQVIQQSLDAAYILRREKAY